MTIDKAFFDREAAAVARDLLGAELLIDSVGGRIVETEAYDATDPASHSFNGPTRRNAAMFGPAGRAYVYRIYGLHWCLNFVCSPGGAVLIRALEPTRGLDLMRRRRGLDDARSLCSGPAKLCQALAVTDGLDHAPLDRPPVSLTPASAALVPVAGPRIGISKGVETPWRFCAEGSRFLSKRA